jgi:hypothetical protein
MASRPADQRQTSEDREILSRLSGGVVRYRSADSLAIAVMYSGRPGEAASAARKGLRKVPLRQPLAARLHARAAEDHARRGNATATADALATARAVCDRLPAQMPSRFGTDTAEHVSYSIAAYAASCSVDLSDWKEAERQARTALGVVRWSPLREARARLDLGTALAHLGSPDGRRAWPSGTCPWARQHRTKARPSPPARFDPS